MACRLLHFASAAFFLFSISSGESSSVDMCENRTTLINYYYLELDAVGPLLSPPAESISKTCSCIINATASNTIDVGIKRIAKDGRCRQKKYAEATMDFIKYSRTLQDDELSYFTRSYDNIATMWFNITIQSICESNYTIELWQDYDRPSVQFSHVTCISSQRVITPPVTTSLPTTPKPTTAVKNDKTVSSTHSSKESSSADSVAEQSTSTSLPVGLIVGVVVGVGGGLLLLGAIVLAVVLFRRRRTKPQPLTNANQNTPTEHSYEPTVEYASISYEELRNSAQLQTDILYDNQTATTDPVDTESGQNYYNLQGNVNSSFHHSDAVSISDQTTAPSEVDNFVRDPHSINDTDTTVIENDLYEK